MAETNINFYEMIEERLQKIEKDMLATAAESKEIAELAEQHRKHCVDVSERTEILNSDMQNLCKTVSCLAEGLITLPDFITLKETKSLSPNLLVTYVSEFHDIFDDHVERTMRKRLDQSYTSLPPHEMSQNQTGIEKEAKDSVRRRLGLSQHELEQLERFADTKVFNDVLAENICDRNNNSLQNVQLCNGSDDETVLEILRDLSMDKSESSRSLRVAIATVHASHLQRRNSKHDDGEITKLEDATLLET
ncbi:hypothetical protein HOLleu_27661 [Holothuria leucospilota]|uniref:Uncharacterized protein n=1 Tax=Holothuria leucospilota TaxID=206669 RepID=A0A9Q1BQW6_HOLLE|nr:hypothetical protein HOLleu_27661 [Holothuria leucospilota]